MIEKLLNKIVKGWVAEYKFHPTRKWRFDFANPTLLIAAEIEGGAFSRGRHTRGKGFISDMEKYNAATLLGWRVLRYTPQQTTEMLRDIKEITQEEYHQEIIVKPAKRLLDALLQAKEKKKEVL